MMIEPRWRVFFAWSLIALAQASAAQSRGELLYATHCIACHTAQMHWREGKRATDWSSLGAQVRRWQANAMLGWSDEDILEVTRHLNDRYYRFAAPGGPTAALGRANAGAADR